MLLDNGAHPNSGEIPNSELVLERLARYRFGTDEGVIKFTRLTSHLVAITTPQSPSDVTQDVIYLGPIEELLNVWGHSLASLFAVYVLFRISAVIRDDVFYHCKRYATTRCPLDAVAIYLPFIYFELADIN